MFDRRRLGARVTTATLPVSGLDPFGVLTDSATKKRSQAGHSSQLHLEQGDETGRRIVRFVRALSIYLLVKMSLVSCIQYHHLEMKLSKRPQLDRRDLSGVLTVEWLLGNPYGILADFAFYLYLGMTGQLVFGLFLESLDRRKLDMCHLRFLLRPQLERARVESAVKQRLRELNVWINSHPRLQLELARGRRGASTPSARQRLEMMLEYVLQQKCSHELKRSARLIPVASLVPEVYSEHWHEKLSHLRDRFLIWTMLCLIVMSLAIYIVAFREIRAAHVCGASRELSANKTLAQLVDYNCKRMTAADLVCMAEMAMMAVITVCMELQWIAASGASFLGHAQLIKSIRASLCRCNKQLALAQQMTGAEIDERAPILDHINSLMLRQLAQFMVNEIELQNGVSSLTHCTTYFSYTVLCATFLHTMTARVSNPVTQPLKTMVLCIIWLGFNALGFTCAHSHARHVALLKHCWSVSARLTEICSKGAPRARNAPKLKGSLMLLTMWQRLVVSAGNNVWRCLVRPLGIGLNFERIIELNFFALLLLTISSDNSTNSKWRP